ncbi:MAG: hypothetical protein HWN67_07220, partial [Candidatus Helarchaeota archaeon]|nr:hypothetical protein [Candidatus Helarchaeota archaeon]
MDKINEKRNIITKAEQTYLIERRANHEIILDIFGCLSDGLPRKKKQIAKETFSRFSTIEKWINYIIIIQNKPKINYCGYIYTIENPNGYEIKQIGKIFRILKSIYSCFESGGRWSISKIHK